jgi:hypothetical protein
MVYNTQNYWGFGLYPSSCRKDKVRNPSNSTHSDPHSLLSSSLHLRLLTPRTLAALTALTACTTLKSLRLTRSIYDVDYKDSVRLRLHTDSSLSITDCLHYADPLHTVFRPQWVIFLCSVTHYLLLNCSAIFIYSYLYT